MSVEAMSLVLNHSTASGTAKLVLIGIANHDGDGGSWPSLATLARYANVDERTVRRALRSLEAIGELRVDLNAGGNESTRNDRRPSRYWITLKPNQGGSASEATTPTPKPGGGNQRGSASKTTTPGNEGTRLSPRPNGGTLVAEREDASVHNEGTPTSPEPSLNHPEKNSPQPPASGGPKLPPCPDHKRWKRYCSDCNPPEPEPLPAPPPPWCGQCDPAGKDNPGQRLIEVIDGSDPKHPSHRFAKCPTCHPGAKQLQPNKF